MPVYDFKTNLFTPLTPEQQATLTEPQLAAYNDLAVAVAERDTVYGEHDNAIAANAAAADALAVAEAAQAKAPKWTRLDEARALIEQSRPGYLAKNGLSLTVVDPAVGIAFNKARQHHVDCQIRLQRAADQRPVANRRVGLAAQAWLNATQATITREELTRQFLAGETQLRKDRAEGRVPEPATPRIANSKIDQFAFYTKAHGRGTGGGRAFGRSLVEGQKVFGPSYQGRVLAPKE